MIASAITRKSGRGDEYTPKSYIPAHTKPRKWIEVKGNSARDGGRAEDRKKRNKKKRDNENCAVSENTPGKCISRGRLHGHLESTASGSGLNTDPLRLPIRTNQFATCACFLLIIRMYDLFLERFTLAGCSQGMRNRAGAVLCRYLTSHRMSVSFSQFFPMGVGVFPFDVRKSSLITRSLKCC